MKFSSVRLESPIWKSPVKKNWQAYNNCIFYRCYYLLFPPFSHTPSKKRGLKRNPHHHYWGIITQSSFYSGQGFWPFLCLFFQRLQVEKVCWCNIHTRTLKHTQQEVFHRIPSSCWNNYRWAFLFNVPFQNIRHIALSILIASIFLSGKDLHDFYALLISVSNKFLITFYNC